MRKVGVLVDRTGQQFNDIVITKELGHGRVMGRCLLCGQEKEYNKGTLVQGKIKNCGCRGSNHLKNYEGKNIGNFLILKELGKARVLARCLLCGRDREYWKQPIVEGRVKSDGCINGQIVDRTGQTFGHILILKELGKGKVFGRCLLCGKERVFDKYSVVHGLTKSCGCAWHTGRKKNGK